MQRVTRAVLVALLASVVLVSAMGSGSEAPAGELGGDYRSFYAAGRLVVEDREHLYDPTVQAAEQREAAGAPADGGQLYFGYPPFFALPYAPLSLVPYRLSYVVHTLAMFGCLALGLHLLRPLAPVLDRWFEQALLGALAFYPMFKAVTGGQNTALTLLLVAVVFRALADDRELVAGAAAAGLLFKPQFALPVIGLLLVGRRLRAVGVAAAGAALLYLLGAAVSGWGWVVEWYDDVRWLDQVDTPANVHNAVSWLGFAEAVFGIDSTVAEVVGWGLAVATGGALAAWWVAGDRGRDLRSRAPALLAVTAPCLLLVPPHVIYYDAGLLVLALVVVAPHLWSSPRARWVLAGVYALGVAQLAASELGASPVWLAVVVVLGWASWLAARPDRLDSYVAHVEVSPTRNRS